MVLGWKTSFVLLTLSLFTLPMNADSVTLLGTGAVSGDASDLSGLTGDICSGAVPTMCAPHNRLGGFGSGLAYTGQANTYIGVGDRGYFDGITDIDYKDRFQVFQINVDPANQKVKATLVDTRLFTNEAGVNLVGQTSAFNTVNPLNSLRFDPEGVRVAADGSLYVSDEYGPYVFHFDRFGKVIERLTVPAKFLIANPSAVGTDELPPGNTAGRQSNRGMEGLAISPDGTTLFGIMQNALIQDGALNDSNSRRGINNRILKIDLATGTTTEYVYQLYNRSNGVNEIVAINDHQFLLVERDGNAGTAAAFKKIVFIDITGATDVSGDVLPQTGQTVVSGTHVGQNFVPVTKNVLFDLLDALYGLAGASFPEKIEGIAFGPDLANGDHMLLVTSDNDLIATPTRIWAFQIPASLIPEYVPQTIQPAWAPGQVKKGK